MFTILTNIKYTRYYRPKLPYNYISAVTHLFLSLARHCYHFIFLLSFIHISQKNQFSNSSLICNGSHGGRFGRPPMCNSARAKFRLPAQCPLSFSIESWSRALPLLSAAYHYGLACAAPGHSRLISSKIPHLSPSFTRFRAASCTRAQRTRVCVRACLSACMRA